MLKGALDDLAEDPDGRRYDWVLLDCPPSLGVMTVAALTAAEGVLIPLQCETLSHRGVGQLLDTVHDVRRFTNRDLEVWGVLPTLYDGRTNHARTVLETISDTYDLDVIEPPIPKTIKFAEAPAAGRSILATSRSSKGARAYREVAGATSVQRSPTRAGELSTHRREVRPRYGRIAVLATSLTISAVAALAGLGVLASGSATAGGAAMPASYTQGTPSESAAAARTPSSSRLGDVGRPRDPDPASQTAVPVDSGSGRRIVFSQSLQRVWLLGQRPDDVTAHLPGLGQRDPQPPAGHLLGVLQGRAGRSASRTPASCSTSCGSPRDRPAPRSASTRSRPRTACPCRPRAQLGTPQSHGCIRQDMPDAIALWNFAPVGTKVVVVA